MKKLLAFFAFVLLSGVKGFCQQDPQLSQYMFNPVVINPGYTGSREVLSSVLVYRHQWVGFDGAPVTQTLSVHAPLKRQKIAVGLQVMHDKIGPRNTTGYFMSYAYRFKLPKGKLSLGLRGGVYDFRYNWSMIDYREDNDIMNSQTRTRQFIPNFDFGTYYFTKKEYAGIALSHLGNPRGLGVDDSTKVSQLFMHMTITGGKAFTVSDNLTFRPSFIVRNAAFKVSEADINLSFLFDNRVWFGVSARTNKSLVAITEVNINPKFRMGYSYDMTFNKLRTTNSGSHEIFIAYDLDIHRSKILSPRYF